MFGPIRAVVVDDDPEHLMLFTAGLAAAGIPCTAHWYDKDDLDPDAKLKPSPPAGGYPHLRVIFSDLNLEEVSAVGEIATVIGPAIETIRRLVGGGDSPYLLVFWTVTSFSGSW